MLFRVCVFLALGFHILGYGGFQANWKSNGHSNIVSMEQVLSRSRLLYQNKSFSKSCLCKLKMPIFSSEGKYIIMAQFKTTECSLGATNNYDRAKNI